MTKYVLISSPPPQKKILRLSLSDPSSCFKFAMYCFKFVNFYFFKKAKCFFLSTWFTSRDEMKDTLYCKKWGIIFFEVKKRDVER